MITRRHLLLLTGVASTQLMVQAIGFLAGLVVLRSLAPAQYGLYTLGLSLVGAATVLADLGLITGVMVQGARGLADAASVRRLLDEAQALHRRLAAVSLLGWAPVLAVLLWRQQADLLQSLLLLAIVGGTSWLQVRAGLALSLVRLYGHVAWQQRLDLLTQLGKLLLILACAGLGSLLSWATLDATVASAVNLALAGASMLGLQAHLRRHLASLPAPSAGTAPIETSDHRSALRGFLRRQAPNSLYHVVNAQVALWLIGWFGHAEQVAEAGALGRLAVLFGVLATVVASLVLPYFARLDSAERVRAGLLRVHAFHAALTLALGGAALAWPGAILWVLGGHYAGLQAELAWMVLASALTAWGGTVYSIGCARDWVQPLWLSAPAGLLATAVTALLVDVGTVRGSLLVQVASAGVGLLVSSAYLAAKARQPLPSHVPTGAGYA